MLYRTHRQAAANQTRALTPQVIRTTPGASEKSNFYADIVQALPPQTKQKKTRIHVENRDSFTTAQKILESHPNAKIGVLNLASDRHPGGGWLRGSLAQEEALCLRSTLAATLKPSYYPLPALGTIFSPGVAVFRDEVVNDCRQYDTQERFLVGVVSVAGLRNPKLSIDEQDYRMPKDIEIMEDKIRQMLRVLAINKISHCVLGALGCGVFNNPPKRVARMFRKVIVEEEFKGYFDEIVFAVLDTGRKGNFNDFVNVIGEFVIE